MPDPELSRWPSPHRAALFWALAALLAGLAAWLAGRGALADLFGAAGILPPLALLAVEIAKNLARGETGVDAVAALSMGGALLLGEHLAGGVVAVMFTGGNVLEEQAQKRA
ncbi:MAG: heavy metal translocating P-type ATPase, partial [Geminicoccaceae bacterium]|nr:heavy metal translocating P-type ATPase [Geminicoccaceae bacterium]